MDLDETLELHKKWLEHDDKGICANLVFAELNGAELNGADLRYAELKHADLRYADLSDAKLNGAKLNHAELNGAYLNHAELNHADLSDADLSDADLNGADLSGADLNWVNWHGCRGIKVYVTGLQSSRSNAQLAYIPDFDVATTGCWQGTWEATKQRVDEVYKEDNKNIYDKYQLAFDYIEAQVKLDKDVEGE